MTISHVSFAAVRPLMAGPPRLLIFHSHAGSGTETAAGVKAYIERQWREYVAGRAAAPTVPQEHLDLDGARTQMLGWDRVGIHSYRATPFAVGVETADPAGVDVNTAPWSEGQLSTLADLAVEWHQVTGWPIERATAWDGHGVGYHSMWGFNSVLFPRRNPWTTDRGKTCPGYRRIAQFDEILTEARRRAAGVTQHPVWPLSLDQMDGCAQATKPTVGAFDASYLVAYLQTVLKVWSGDDVPLSGVFDGATVEAVIKFQQAVGLVADGVVGRVETWPAVDWVWGTQVRRTMVQSESWG